MATMITVVCKCGCGETRRSRLAEVNRGHCVYINRAHAARDVYRRTRETRNNKRKVNKLDSGIFNKLMSLM